MSLCKVSDLPFDKMLLFDRCGIVPCKKINGKLIMAFGIDRDSGDISNYSGKPIITDGGPINASIREFMEETYGVFGCPTAESLTDSFCIYNDTELIIFAMTDWNSDEVCRKFNRIKTSDSEMSELCFLTANDLMLALAESGTSKFYDRVRNLFVDAILNNGFIFDGPRGNAPCLSTTCGEQ